MLILGMLPALMPSAYADDVRTLEGEYEHKGNQSQSINECKAKALEGARIKALATAFGTTVGQEMISTTIGTGANEHNRFMELQRSEVKGEWLGDIGEPEYQISISPDGSPIVKCKVKGKAKALSNKGVDFETLVLRNGTTKKHADTNFRHKDYMYLYFTSPVAGYLQVYLADEAGQVYGILPYLSGGVSEIKVKKGYDYIFFDKKRGDEFGIVDELYLTAPEGVEYNKIYVVFSPDPFTPPALRNNGTNVPSSVTAEEFSKWLIKSRSRDDRMSVKTVNIVIAP